MHSVEPARRSARSRSHSRLVAASCLLVVAAFVALAACGAASRAREATIEKLAVGTWACAADDSASHARPFTITVTSHGTFSLMTDDAAKGPSAGPQGELHGTWSIAHGTLDWGFNDIPMKRRFQVEGFSALTPHSTSFTIEDPGPFTSASPPDPDHQKILTTVHGTDSVTLQIPEGEPWTCHRQ